MPGLFNHVSAELKSRLNHAFRYGASAFRFGLMPQSVSDHLPVLADLPLGEGRIQMLSWNLLADEHLFNNFMNISGSDYLEAALDKKITGTETTIYSGAMYHLLAELAQYLFKHKVDGQLKITRKLLEGFVPNDAQPSRRARSRNPETAQLKIHQVEAVRKHLVVILCDAAEPHAHEYQLALRQCIELIYHIQSPEGALQ